MKQEKNTTGINIVLSVVVTLFIIGLLIFIFAVMGGSISDATAETINAQVINASITFNETCTPIAPSNISNVVVITLDNETIPPEEYTVVGNCIIANI